MVLAPLIRPARLTLSGNLLASPLFDANWTANAATLAALAARGPNGRPDAAILTEDSATDHHQISQTISKATSALAYQATCYIKRGPSGSRDASMTAIEGTFSHGAQCAFSLTDGTYSIAPGIFGDFTNASGTMRRLPGGWFRVTLSFTTDAANNLIIILKLGSGSYAGNGTSNILLWGADLRLT